MQGAEKIDGITSFNQKPEALKVKPKREIAFTAWPTSKERIIFRDEEQLDRKESTKGNQYRRIMKLP